MKTFTYHLGGQELTIRLDEAHGTIASIKVDGQHPALTPEEMPYYAAAISLALLAYDVEVVHDDEPGVITLAPTESGWSNPSALMSAL